MVIDSRKKEKMDRRRRGADKSTAAVGGTGATYQPGASPTTDAGGPDGGLRERFAHKLRDAPEHVAQLLLSSGRLEEHGTSPDGDCLFSSVAAMLRSAPAEHAALIDGCLEASGQRWRCSTATPDILRSAVASHVLDPTCKLMNDAIASWIEIARSARSEGDHALMIEYGHVRCVLDCADPANLTQGERRALFASMSRKQYWGEQIALQMLRDMLGMALLVLDHNGQLMHQLHDKPAPSGIFGVLHLSGRHFQPISVHGKLTFREHELPFVLALPLAASARAGKPIERLSSDALENVQRAEALFDDPVAYERARALVAQSESRASLSERGAGPGGSAGYPPQQFRDYGASALGYHRGAAGAGPGARLHS